MIAGQIEVTMTDSDRRTGERSNDLSVYILGDKVCMYSVAQPDLHLLCRLAKGVD